jgi:hypothetical protein
MSWRLPDFRDQISKATQFGIEAAGVMAREEMDDNTVKGFKKYINIFEETKHTHSSTHTWRPIVRNPSILFFFQGKPKLISEFQVKN